jgi:hypothetical protein
MMIDSEKEGPTLPPFKSWNKYVQIAFLGLMIGGGAFGAYATIMGLMNFTEKPLLVSDDKIDTIYPLSAEQFFYRNNLRTELIIYNNEPWDVGGIWIGTEDEYDAYMNNKLVDSNQHLFVGPFNTISGFKYKIPIKAYLVKSDILSNIFKDERIIITMVDGVKTRYSIVTIGEKETAQITVTEIKQ